MKTYSRYFILALLTLLIVPHTGLAIQTDRAGRVSKPPPTVTPSKKRGNTTPPTTGTKGSAASRKSVGRVKLAELTINATQPGCQVSLDGGPAKMTDPNGMLKFPSLAPGKHILIVRKANYREEQRTIFLDPGQSKTETIVMTLIAGTLNVTSNQGGIEIEVSNIGKYSERVEALALPPGRYLVTASKLGYRNAVHGVEIKPSQVSNLTVMLESLPVEELVTQSKEQYEKKNYDRTIVLARAALEKEINQPKAHALIGSALYSKGAYEESIAYLARAVALGESITIGVKHRHGGSWDGKSLCTGLLTLRPDAFEFYSNQFPDEGFKLPYNKIYEMSIKDEMRLFTKLGLTKPDGKEGRKEYNFYSLDADATGRIVLCPSCLSQMQVVLNIIRQFRSRS